MRMGDRGEYIVDGLILAGIEGSIAKGKLVRCKDCLHWVEDVQDVSRTGYCDNMVITTARDWFCAAGEVRA